MSRKASCACWARWATSAGRARRTSPTFKEQGYDIVSGSQRGIAGPKGMPQEDVDKLAAAIEQAIHDPEFRQKAEEQALPLRYLGPKEYQELLNSASDEAQQIWNEHPLGREVSPGRHLTGPLNRARAGPPRAPFMHFPSGTAMKLVELAVALVVLALAGAGLVDAVGFPRASAYLPTAVLGLTCVLSLVWAAQSVVGDPPRAPVAAAGSGRDPPTADAGGCCRCSTR